MTIKRGDSPYHYHDTHRLTGLETMNEILVLDQGQIIERGTHQELINSGGLYHNMYQLQQNI